MIMMDKRFLSFSVVRACAPSLSLSLRFLYVSPVRSVSFFFCRLLSSLFFFSTGTSPLVDETFSFSIELKKKKKKKKTTTTTTKKKKKENEDEHKSDVVTSIKVIENERIVLVALRPRVNKSNKLSANTPFSNSSSIKKGGLYT